jgi:hypothetical protein
MQGSAEVMIQDLPTYSGQKGLASGAETDRYFTLSLIGYGNPIGLELCSMTILSFGFFMHDDILDGFTVFTVQSTKYKAS